MRWYSWRLGRLIYAPDVAVNGSYISDKVRWKPIGWGLFWGTKLF